MNMIVNVTIFIRITETNCVKSYVTIRMTETVCVNVIFSRFRF